MHVTMEEDILFNEDLTIQEKVIVSLTKSMGKVFISNEKFGKMLGVSKSRVSAIITGLVKKGYLNVDCKREKGVNTERTITLGTIFKTVSNAVKKAVSKAKELKADYVPVEQQVGTQKVQQQSFGNKFYKKHSISQNANQKRKGNIHAPMCSHNIDWNALAELEQQRNFIIE